MDVGKTKHSTLKFVELMVCGDDAYRIFTTTGYKES
jgi:hypothetical protein